MDTQNCKLILGDSTEVMRGMESCSIDLIITSPPYWNQKEYSFWPEYSDYMASVDGWVKECARLIRPGRHIFWNIPDKLPYPPKENGTGERLYMPIYADTEAVASSHGMVCEFPIIWKKPHGSQKMFGSYPYPPTIIHTPMTERICVWRKPGKADLSRKSDESMFTKEQWVDWAQDLWEIAPVSNKNHPAPFPIEIPRRIMSLWSFVGDTILDPFCGSGTTAIACLPAKRKFVGIELCEQYYKVAMQQIGLLTNQMSLDI